MTRRDLLQEMRKDGWTPITGKFAYIKGSQIIDFEEGYPFQICLKRQKDLEICFLSFPYLKYSDIAKVFHRGNNARNR